MRALLASLMIVGFGTSAGANDSVVMGAGTASCGEYATAYRSAPSATDDLFISWVNGFISGMNTSAIFNDLPAKKIGTYESHKQFLHIYCDAHPLNDVGKAAVELYKSLPTTNPKK